jgi:GntR family transcriptional regulator
VKISIERIAFEADAVSNEELETEVMCLRRARTADGVPFAYTVAYLPLSLKGLVLDEQAYLGSLYIYLQEKCGVFISEAETVIEAQVAAGEISQKLGVPPQTPILALHQRHYNQIGKLLVKSDDYYVQNRLQLKIKHSRPGII